MGLGFSWAGCACCRGTFPVLALVMRRARLRWLAGSERANAIGCCYSLWLCFLRLLQQILTNWMLSDTLMCCHLVPEARSSKPRCRQGQALPETCGGGSFLASLLASGGACNPWGPLACSCVSSVSASVIALLSSLCTSSLLIRAPAILA